MPRIATLKFFVGVEASATWHPRLSQWRPLFVDSQRLIARSQNRTKCVEYVWLSYPMWPSRWVLCISMQRLRSKGCHVACDEWTSGEICSLQHMWVTGSVMWAAVNDESLKFGVQGVITTNWFPRVNGARDNGIWLYTLFVLLTFRGEIIVKQDYIKTFCPGIGTSIIKRWSDIILSLQWEFATVKPVYKDHLIGYFSAFWISRRQTLLAGVNWYIQSSLKHTTE